MFNSFCHPMDCSPPGSSVHEILQARILEWVDITFSRGSFWPKDQTRVSAIAGRFFTIWAKSWPSINDFTEFWPFLPWEAYPRLGSFAPLLIWQPTPLLLPGRSQGTEEPGGLCSMGPQRARHGWGTKCTHTHTHTHTHTRACTHDIWKNSGSGVRRHKLRFQTIWKKNVHFL